MRPRFARRRRGSAISADRSKVNFEAPEQAREKLFENPTPLYPQEKFGARPAPEGLRVASWTLTPIGKDSAAHRRPPRDSKTMLPQSTRSRIANHPEVA
jgi:transcription termination factor Rho